MKLLKFKLYTRPKTLGKGKLSTEIQRLLPLSSVRHRWRSRLVLCQFSAACNVRFSFPSSYTPEAWPKTH